MARSVSKRWKETVEGVANWVTYVDWSTDGGVTWETAPEFYSGTVSCDTTSQVRWRASGLTIGGVPINQNATKTEDGINPFRTRFRIRHGLDYGFEEELIGMGVYRCRSAHESTTDEGRVVLSGESFESYFIKPAGAFPKPRHFSPQSVRTMMDKLIKEVVSNAVIVYRPGVDADTPLPSLIGSEDRWDLINGQSDSPSLVRSIGARVFTGGDGEWIVSLPGSLGDTPTFESAITRNQYSADRELSNQGVYNVVSVKAQTTDGKTKLPTQIILDDDPYSPTYARLKIDNEGGSGVMVRYYTSSLFTSTDQMIKTGRSILAQTLGLRQQVSFNRAYDPSIEAWDVGMADVPGGPQRVITDAMEYDLTGNSEMSGEARTTSSQYSGQVGTWVDETEGGGGDELGG